MTIEGWFDSRGRPLFEAELLLPGQGIRVTMEFLADTGSDRTLLMPSAAAKLPLDLEQLGASTGRIAGVGGSVRVARIPARIVFYGSNAYLYDLDVGIVATGGQRSPVDALLGRDILARWYLHCERRTNLLRAEKISADDVFPLPAKGT